MKFDVLYIIYTVHINSTYLRITSSTTIFTSTTTQVQPINSFTWQHSWNTLHQLLCLSFFKNCTF